MAGAAVLSAYALVAVGVRGGLLARRYGYTYAGLVVTYFLVVPTVSAAAAVLWPLAKRLPFGSLLLGALLGAGGLAAVALPMQPLHEWLATLPWYTAFGALMGGWASRNKD
jgi:hypothetical protein